MRISVETQPIVYTFSSSIKIQSTEKDGEEYLNKLMHYYNDNGFKIINGTYKSSIINHDRLGNHKYCEVIKVEMNVEKIVHDIHSPSDYAYNVLDREIKDIFDRFNINDDKLNYITWISNMWKTN